MIRVVAALDAARRVGLRDVADELAAEVPADGDVVVAADDLADRVAGVAGRHEAVALVDWMRMLSLPPVSRLPP